MENKSKKILSSIFTDFKKGNKNIAILKMKNYLLKNSKDYQARLNLAYMFINTNMIDKAIKEYKVILKQNKNLEAMFNLAICYYNLKQLANKSTGDNSQTTNTATATITTPNTNESVYSQEIDELFDFTTPDDQKIITSRRIYSDVTSASL